MHRGLVLVFLGSDGGKLRVRIGAALVCGLVLLARDPFRVPFLGQWEIL